MEDKIMFEKDNRTLKNPKHFEKKIFLLYSPRNVTITMNYEPASNKKIDTEITAFLPRNSKGHITSKCRTNKNNELFYRQHRLWLETLNKSFEDNIENKKGASIGFIAVESKKLKFYYVPLKANAKKGKKGYTSKNKKAD